MKRYKYQDPDPTKAVLADEQTERAFLLALLSDMTATRIAKELQGVIVDDDFTSDQQRAVWRLVLACLEDSQQVSTINVYSQAVKRNVEFDVTRYINTQSPYADALALGYTLHNIGNRRRLAERVHDVYCKLMMDFDTTTEECLADITKATEATTAQAAKRVEKFGDVYTELVKVTQDTANGVRELGVPCGFSLIDKKGGLERGELMIIAGRNSNGKTSLALCMALNAAMQGAAVGIFSLEMSNLKLATRLTSLLTGIDGTAIKFGDLTQEQWSKFIGLDTSAPIYFDKARATDGDALIANIKGMVATKGVQVVVIDYLQLLSGKERDQRTQIGNIAHRLEALSTQLDITIILLSQLRRNQPADPMPRLEELKESGDIADAADSIYMVYRPERHSNNIRYPDMGENWSEYDTHGTALLICYKNRNGAMTGEQMLGFDAATTKFYERDDFAKADGTMPPPITDILDTPF